MGTQDWGSIFDVAASLYLFALGTQCALAWIFALLFPSFLRAADGPHYFRAWTWAWLARAFALSVIIVRFTVPLARGEHPETLDGGLFSSLCYGLYQGAKFLSNGWLLEGLLLFAGCARSRARERWGPALLVLAACVSVFVSEDVEQLLLFQSPLVVAVSLSGALLLLRLPSERRSAGTRITAGALLVQGVLWILYFAIYLDHGEGAWPIERSPRAVLAAHNSYFDLAVDVLVASGLVVLLLQDVHQRQLQGEKERARLRAELDRSERLRSLGTLVSGVAHELNNPLAAILGFAEALETTADEAERGRQAQIIREQALRCRRIVRGLATFSGKGSEDFEPIEVRALLERVTRGFEFELLQKRVGIALDAPESLAPLRGDRFALEQMVANLLANALQASPAGGRIRLAARSLGAELELAVEDEGPGIPPEIREHVFDPFFTTRVPGEGMGLGLSVVHGIVRAHNGSIRAESRTPRGTRMLVRLPLLRARAPGDELAERDVPRPSAHGPRALALLVIEDEPLLCEMLAMLGARRGWRVSLAQDGAAGLEQLRAGSAAFDAVLCDLRMPGPTGIEIHDRLAAEAPHLLERFLFVTGDLDSADTLEFAARCRRPILRKPFRIDELAAQVEELAALRSVAWPNCGNPAARTSR